MDTRTAYYAELEFIDRRPLRLFEQRPTMAMQVAGVYPSKKLAKQAAEAKRRTLVDYWNWKPVVHKTYIELPERRFV